MKEIGKSLIGLDDPIEIIRALKAAIQHPLFDRYCELTAMRMVTHIFQDGARTWREAARMSGKDRLIYHALQNELQEPLGGAVNELIARNATYIKSVPQDIARAMTEHVMSQSMAGLRSSDIAKDLQRMFPHISNVKANLIARTETSKTSTALNQARSETLGIQWYRWRTSEDARVRESHRHMDKVLVAWDDPPSPEALEHERSYGRYNAGETFNCRCYTEPLVDLSFVSWPCRVYVNGRIVTMTRAQFERMAGMAKAV